MVWFHRILFTAAVLAAGAALYFFCWGLLDGTVSSFNAGLWTGLLAVVIAVPVAGHLLRSHGHPWVAVGVLLITAVPALLYLVFILAVLIFQPRWN